MRKQLLSKSFCSIKIWLQTSSHFKHVVLISHFRPLHDSHLCRVKFSFLQVQWFVGSLYHVSGEEVSIQTGYDAFIKPLVPDFSAPPCTSAQHTLHVNFLTCRSPIFAVDICSTFAPKRKFKHFRAWSDFIFPRPRWSWNKNPHARRHVAMVWYLFFDRSQNLFYPSWYILVPSLPLAAYKSYQFYDSAPALRYQAIKHKPYLRHDGKWYRPRKRL